MLSEIVHVKPNKAYFLVSRSLTTLQAATPLASKAPASVLPLNIGPCFDHLCSNMSDQQEGLPLVCTTGRLVFAAEHSTRKLFETLRTAEAGLLSCYGKTFCLNSSSNLAVLQFDHHCQQSRLNCKQIHKAVSKSRQAERAGVREEAAKGVAIGKENWNKRNRDNTKERQTRASI